MIVSCNYQMIDTTWNYDTAIVRLADGTVVEGKCDGWIDYEDSDMVQVTIDGKVYLTHITNVTLIAE
jgi:hypothetical protein